MGLADGNQAMKQASDDELRQMANLEDPKPMMPPSEVSKPKQSSQDGDSKDDSTSSSSDPWDNVETPNSFDGHMASQTQA